MAGVAVERLVVVVVAAHRHHGGAGGGGGARPRHHLQVAGRVLLALRHLEAADEREDVLDGRLDVLYARRCNQRPHDKLQMTLNNVQEHFWGGGGGFCTFSSAHINSCQLCNHYIYF